MYIIEIMVKVLCMLVNIPPLPASPKVMVPLNNVGLTVVSLLDILEFP